MLKRELPAGVGHRFRRIDLELHVILIAVAAAGLAQRQRRGDARSKHGLTGDRDVLAGHGAVGAGGPLAGDWRRGLDGDDARLMVLGRAIVEAEEAEESRERVVVRRRHLRPR